jgi:hypothetical protein
VSTNIGHVTIDETGEPRGEGFVFELFLVRFTAIMVNVLNEHGVEAADTLSTNAAFLQHLATKCNADAPAALVDMAHALDVAAALETARANTLPKKES